MVPFAGYELPVLHETEWGGFVKGESGLWVGGLGGRISSQG